MVASADVEAPLGAPDTLHLLPMLAFRLALFDSEFLEEDIGGVEHTACITCVCALVAAKASKLCRLHLRRPLRTRVILSEEITAELCLCYSRLPQMCGDLLTYL